MIVGEQCLEIPAGANRAKAGGTMTVPPNVPMELSLSGLQNCPPRRRITTECERACA
jgi:hypothetical protein